MNTDVNERESDDAFLQELKEVTEYGREKLRIAGQKRPFCIVVCGVFSSGKTSLINALLGIDLPTGIEPVTKVVTRIRYGPSSRVVVLAPNDRSEREISLETARSIILNKAKDDRYRNLQVYIELPSEFLKNDIEIIDTPGLDDDRQERLDELTKQEIRNADFCVVNYMSTKFAQKSEREFLEEIQELTDGNFVSVLNCLNYLQQGEQQLIDLEERASHVLSQYGNDRVGRGRYFRVDSQDRNDAFLDGLDTWLLDTVRKYGRVMQADTPLTMAYVELKNIKKKCDDYVNGLYDKIDQLRQANDTGIRQQKKRAKLEKHKLESQLASDKIREKDILTSMLSNGLREKLRRIALESGTEKYRVAAEACIRDVILSFQRAMCQRVRENYGALNGCTYDISGEFQQCICGFKAAEPTSTIHERGIFDIDRYRHGQYYRVYNDYVQETQDEVDSLLLPRLKLRIDAYFHEVEICAAKELDGSCIGGSEEEIRQMEALADRISEASMDAMEVLHQVRKARDTLIQERI